MLTRFVVRFRVDSSLEGIGRPVLDRVGYHPALGQGGIAMEESSTNTNLNLGTVDRVSPVFSSSRRTHSQEF